MIEHIIVVGICVVIIAIIGYYLYSKINTQQDTIDQLIKRYRSLEAVIYRPPPRTELTSLFNQQSADPNCESCMISPVVPQTTRVDYTLENATSTQDRIEPSPKLPENENVNAVSGIMEHCDLNSVLSEDTTRTN
jgi:Chordopoxvirus A13L protein